MEISSLLKMFKLPWLNTKLILRGRDASEIRMFLELDEKIEREHLCLLSWSITTII